MQKQGTRPTPAVSPMLAYEDPAAALEWLTKAFGFEERERITMPDGSIGHAELATAGGGLIMLAGGIPNYESPRRHAESCAVARRWLEVPWVINGVHVYVDDVDAHVERARQAGATILSEPEDDGHGRAYRVADLEGHRWMFMQRPEGSS